MNLFAVQIAEELRKAELNADEKAAMDVLGRVARLLEANGAEEPMSAFELLKSGMVEALLGYITADGMCAACACPLAIT